MIEEGVYKELSSDDYHADKDSLSRSALMEFKKSPYRYWARHLNPARPKEEPKPSWIFGSAFHTLMLEPHLFDKNYILKPAPVLLKDVGREAYDKYKNVIAFMEVEEQKGKIALNNYQWDALTQMKNAVLKHPKASKLIENAIYECSFFWRDPHSGLMVKSRPDILHSHIYVDLKTIDDASPYSFQRSMATHGYHLQAAMVKDAVQVLGGDKLSACINLCVEKTYPYSIGIYIIDESAVEQGQLEYRNLLLDLSVCKRDNAFNDYSVETVGLPKWAM